MSSAFSAGGPQSGPSATGADKVVGPTRDLLVVILGGDIGAYSAARAFYEGYGIKPVIVSGVATGIVRDSFVATNKAIGEDAVDDPEIVVQVLRAIAAERPESKRLLLGSADWHVRTLVEQRSRLDDLFTIPYVGQQLLDQVTDKESFAALCRELKISHPATVVFDCSSSAAPDTTGLRFPIIAKAANTTAYHHTEFAGKKKVFLFDDAEALNTTMANISAAGYTDSFVLQDFIPGGDGQARVLTCYSDRSGVVRFAAFGEVLIEEHTPGALGNSAAIITTVDEHAVSEATRLLQHVGWTGYACFDIKVDPRDGTYQFFEVNARLGRGNYYMTAAGANVAQNYVHEHIDGGFFTGLSQLDHEHLYTVVPRRLLRKYTRDAAQLQKAKRLIKIGEATNPLWSRLERSPKRWWYVAVAQLNQFRKFKAWYPPA